ncbi:MAG: carboxylate-amine ligase [Candidatus Tectomicrobia bacterium]|nr:carboxylate-amine ligase [Candidatus Tectomicrobia bacterium]
MSSKPAPSPDLPFTMGIEEEYLVVDRRTRDLIREAPPDMMQKCGERLGEQVTTELMQCQVEIGTRVCNTVQEGRDELIRLRRGVSDVVREYGFEIIAASTHPFAQVMEIQRTRKERYDSLTAQMQEVGRRLLISGMHVHVGLDGDEMRNDFIGQVSYVLPHFLALSTSSPFWQGHDTGLKSYRLAVWDELPRTGLPELYESYGEYRRHVDVLVRCGVIRDSTELWWDVRPSERFPTLEMRIPDLCTRVEDAVCIAALYRCWLRLLYRLRRSNQRWRRYARLLIEENRWRAHRFGMDEGLIDFGRGEVVPYPHLLDEIIEFIREDAEHFGCVDEVEHARTIVARGTSAHWQLDTFHKAIVEGADDHEALKRVVDMLVEQTLVGC